MLPEKKRVGVEKAKSKLNLSVLAPSLVITNHTHGFEP